MLRQEGRVIFNVVEHTDIGSSLGVYQKEVMEGRNSKYIASKCITGQQAELDVF